MHITRGYKSLLSGDERQRKEQGEQEKEEEKKYEQRLIHQLEYLLNNHIIILPITITKDTNESVAISLSAIHFSIHTHTSRLFIHSLTFTRNLYL